MVVGEMNIRIMSVFLIGSLALLAQGCRLTWNSCGASSEPVAINFESVARGELLPDRHIELGPHVAYANAGAAGQGFVVYPVGPVPANGQLPGGIGRSLLVKAKKGVFFSEAQIVSEGSGLITGKAGDVVPASVRTALKRRMKVNDVKELSVLELGKRPSTLMGLLMIVGGAVMFVGGGWVMMKNLGDS
jgi:hypothetical protein